MQPSRATPPCALLASALTLSASLWVAACDSEPQVAVSRQALRAECTTADAGLPDGAWSCPDPHIVQCVDGDATADVEVIYWSEASCSDGTLGVSDPGPFSVGTHSIAITDEDGATLCDAELVVVDEEAPVLEAHTVSLWPPNHKWHAIAVEDCVSAVDACEGELRGEFIWVSSDEPVDGLGDGHHSPDIQFDGCQALSVRAERQGGADGRVYTLGVRVTDSSGNTSEAQCQVVVDHDQRGVVAVAGADAYRVELDGMAGRPLCGETPTADDDAGL